MSTITTFVASGSRGGDAFAESIDRLVRQVCNTKFVGDGVRVTTACMYPSNGFVRVMVRGGLETIVVSDEGEAVGEVLSAGVFLKNPDKIIAPLVRPQGLLVRDGAILTPRMPFDAAPLAISLVANASKEIAQWMYDHMKIKRERDFRKLLANFLKKTFEERVSPEKIIGASNKAHKFENVIHLPGNRRLIVDPVTNEASSINSRVVANLDVRAVNNRLIEQRIVYDDEESWSPADLNRLQVGATVVPFSRAQEVIERVAHARS